MRTPTPTPYPARAGAARPHDRVETPSMVGTLAESRPTTPLVAPAPYVTIRLAAVLTGLSEKAIRRKIEDGKWIEGREYRRSPDGGIFISVRGYAQWVERAMA